MNTVSNQGKAFGQPSKAEPMGARQIKLISAMLVVASLLLIIVMTGLLVGMAPTLLQPGSEISGRRFNGTVAQGQAVVALFSWLVLLGMVGLGIGLRQWRSGARNARLMRCLGVMILLAVVGAVWVYRLFA